MFSLLPYEEFASFPSYIYTFSFSPFSFFYRPLATLYLPLHLYWFSVYFHVSVCSYAFHRFPILDSKFSTPPLFRQFFFFVLDYICPCLNVYPLHEGVPPTHKVWDGWDGQEQGLLGVGGQAGNLQGPEVQGDKELNRYKHLDDSINHSINEFVIQSII